MTDFWTMMALLVTKRRFRKELFSLPKANYHVGTTQRAPIPYADYETMRGIVQPYMRNTPLSLMALGEMLIALNQDSFRFHAELVALAIEAALKAKKKKLPTSRTFKIAFGALILDQPLAGRLLNDGKWADWGFGFVPRRERNFLETFMNRDQNLEVVNSIGQFCYNLWGHECNDNVISWDTHTHPVAL